MSLNWLTLTMLGGAFLGGMLLALLPCLLQVLSQRLTTVDAFWIRRLKTVFTFVLVPSMLVCGQVLDRWGSSDILYDSLILGSLCAVVGMGLLALRNTYRAALAAAGLLGIGAACLLPAATLLMPAAFFNGQFAVHAFNLGYVAVGLGVLLTGPVLAVLQNRLGLEKGLLLLALLALLYSAFVALPPKEALAFPGKTYDAHYFFADLRLALACLVVFFFFPLESSLGGWASQYLTDLGFKASRIPWVLALFWLCFLGTRLSTGLLLKPRFDAFLLVFLVSAIAVTFWNLAGAGPSSGAKGMLVLWACHGPVFPTLLGLVLPHTHGSATAFALLFGAGAVGTLLFQPALGAPAATAQATLRLPRALALLLAAPALILVFI